MLVGVGLTSFLSLICFMLWFSAQMRYWLCMHLLELLLCSIDRQEKGWWLTFILTGLVLLILYIDMVSYNVVQSAIYLGTELCGGKQMFFSWHNIKWDCLFFYWWCLIIVKNFEKSSVLSSNCDYKSAWLAPSTATSFIIVETKTFSLLLLYLWQR